MNPLAPGRYSSVANGNGYQVVMNHRIPRFAGLPILRAVNPPRAGPSPTHPVGSGLAG